MADDELSGILRRAIAESIWSTPSVDTEPVVRLIDWQVFELDGVRRVLGYHYAAREGRLSTEIRSVDPNERRLVTASGRVYHLEGPPGWSKDADWVLQRWLYGRKVTGHDIRYVPLEELFPGPV